MLGYLAFMVSQIIEGLTIEKGILLAILSFFMLSIGYEFTFNRNNIPTMNTDTKLMRKMVALLKEHSATKSGEIYQVMDCGSGNGKLTRMIARGVPQSKVLGLENSKWPFMTSVFCKRLLRITNLEYVRRDFFAQDYSSANAVVVFLNARVTEAIGKKLHADLKPNSMVITNEFELKGDWSAPEVHTIYTPFKGHLYVYTR
ncbi:MAG: class I SAM-dependent methyltransferase [Alphaproteobacteria bacterium]|nr:class I SAM-dependent methyltransferase [Alphaproteobacteria bacterium]